MAQIIKRMTFEDIEGLEKLHRDMKYDYPLPDLRSLMIGYKALKGDNVVGYGLIHHIMEASIVLDKNQTGYSRIQTIKNLLEAGTDTCRQAGVSQLYTFTDIPFTKVLRQLDFRAAKGDVSVMDII